MKDKARKKKKKKYCKTSSSNSLFSSEEETKVMYWGKDMRVHDIALEESYTRMILQHFCKTHLDIVSQLKVLYSPGNIISRDTGPQEVKTLTMAWTLHSFLARAPAINACLNHAASNRLQYVFQRMYCLFLKEKRVLEARVSKAEENSKRSELWRTLRVLCDEYTQELPSGEKRLQKKILRKYKRKIDMVQTLAKKSGSTPKIEQTSKPERIDNQIWKTNHTFPTTTHPSFRINTAVTTVLNNLFTKNAKGKPAQINLESQKRATRKLHAKIKNNTRNVNNASEFFNSILDINISVIEDDIIKYPAQRLVRGMFVQDFGPLHLEFPPPCKPHIKESHMKWTRYFSDNLKGAIFDNFQKNFAKLIIESLKDSRITLQKLRCYCRKGSHSTYL